MLNTLNTLSLIRPLYADSGHGFCEPVLKSGAVIQALSDWSKQPFYIPEGTMVLTNTHLQLQEVWT